MLRRRSRMRELQAAIADLPGGGGNAEAPGRHRHAQQSFPRTVKLGQQAAQVGGIQFTLTNKHRGMGVDQVKPVAGLVIVHRAPPLTLASPAVPLVTSLVL